MLAISPTFSLPQLSVLFIFRKRKIGAPIFRLLNCIFCSQRTFKQASSPALLFCKQFNALLGQSLCSFEAFFSGLICLHSTFTSFHTCGLPFLPKCIAPVPHGLTSLCVFSPGIPTRLALQCLSFSEIVFFFFLSLCVPAGYTFWAIFIAAIADCLLRTDSACCCCEGFVLLGRSCSWHYKNTSI